MRGARVDSAPAEAAIVGMLLRRELSCVRTQLTLNRLSSRCQRRRVSGPAEMATVRWLLVLYAVIVRRLGPVALH